MPRIPGNRAVDCLTLEDRALGNHHTAALTVLIHFFDRISNFLLSRI